MFLSRFEIQVYSILRIITGFLFLWHGSMKLFDFPPSGHETTGILQWTAGIIEFFGGAMIALGLFTRWAAFIACGEMAVAYWMVHGTHAILPITNHGELAMLFCFIFLFIIFKGSGIFSIDSYFIKKKHS